MAFDVKTIEKKAQRRKSLSNCVLLEPHLGKEGDKAGGLRGRSSNLCQCLPVTSQRARACIFIEKWQQQKKQEG